MGFFSKWFGRSKRNEAEGQLPSADQQGTINNFFFTNAPEHWGPFSTDFLKSNKNFVNNWEASQSNTVIDKRSFMVNSLALMGMIREVFEKTVGDKVLSSYNDGLLEFEGAYATTCCVEKLFSKGIFSLNGIAIDNHERYGVVLFNSPTPMKYLEELKACCVEEGFKDLIYFTLYDPSQVEVEKKLIFEDFNKNCFTYRTAEEFAAKRKFDRYALWWADKPDDDFLKSSVKSDMGICIDMMDFYESYTLGILSYAFGLKGDNNRTRLPDEDWVNMEGPEGVQIVLSLSQQMGIIFLFPALPRYARYRDNFMKTYVKFCYGIREQILEGNFPKDAFGQPSVMEWYNNLLAQAEANRDYVNAICVYSKQKWHNFSLN